MNTKRWVGRGEEDEGVKEGQSEGGRKAGMEKREGEEVLRTIRERKDRDRDR